MQEPAKKRKPAKQFEDLEIYQQARSLANQIYSITGGSAFTCDYSLRDQIRRAAVSILSNIAEGFERGSDAAFAHALTIAKGSCGELRAQIGIAFDQKYFDEQTRQVLEEECRRLSAGLSKLITYLKTSTRQR